MAKSMDKPELETLDYKPRTDPKQQCGCELCEEAQGNLKQPISVIRPAKRVNKADNASQAICERCQQKNCQCRKIIIKEIEQPIDAQKLTKKIIATETELRAMGNKPKSECSPEQPNPELMIVKTIQGLTSVINNELSKLNELTKFLSCNRNSLVLQALEDIDIFQRTTLNGLQKAFE